MTFTLWFMIGCTVNLLDSLIDIFTDYDNFIKLHLEAGWVAPIHFVVVAMIWPITIIVQITRFMQGKPKL